ncbi:MAG: histidine kinase, partial [Calditrichaeota bacterium]|nr:histidine kinase [Calditrichota bacterium]
GNKLKYWQFRAGDDLNWAESKSDSGWQTLRIDKENYILNKHDGNFWLRTTVYIADSLFYDQILVLTHYALYSADEVYWDGDLILENGRVADNKEDERLGQYRPQVKLSKCASKKGLHTIAIRVSNHHFKDQKNTYGFLNIGLLDFYYGDDIRWLNEVVMITTILLTSALFSLILFFGLQRKVSYLLFSLFLIMQSVKLLFKYIWGMYDLQIDTYHLMGFLIDMSFPLGNFFLLSFLIFEFNLPKRLELNMSAFVLTFLLAYILPTQATIFELIFAFILMLYAVYKRLENSIISLVGILGLGVCTYLGYEEQLYWGYFIGIMFYITCLFLVAARHMWKTAKLHQESVLRSARLENQLIKKNIQPHFLMNSLVSLQQLIKEHPQKASSMIDALADEFHLFSKISENKLIPITDELKICDAHLKIMQFRKDATFTMEQIGIDGTEQIPPAVFHTLIENGISHGYGNRNEGKFVLEKIKLENGIRYRLFNDGDIDCEPRHRKNGSGTKYIIARLNESYGDKWKLESQPVENGWEVTIDLYN